MANPLFTSETLPSTAVAAITEFLDRYAAAQGAATADTWVDAYGDSSPISAPTAVFPIGQMSIRYAETRGENRFKTAQETSFEVNVREFDAGAEEKAMNLFTNAAAYKRWQQKASGFITGEANHRAKSIAALLEAGTSTTIWDGGVFFRTDHPANISDDAAGTFGNYQSSAKDVVSITNILAEATEMMGVLDENGEKLGVVPDTILCPTAKYLHVDSLLKQQHIPATSGTQDNPLYGNFKAVHVPQLTDVNDWYLVDSKLISMVPPWASLRFAGPDSLGLRIYDESSDFFKDTGKLRVSSHIWYGFALVFPHAIRKIVGA